MFHGIPIIGITGGIGSGKSFVGRLFGELGCLVIESDAQVRAAYERPDVKAALRAWWGHEAFDVGGHVDRRAVARRVFADPAERARLEGLLHPLVRQMRDEQMAAAVDAARAGEGPPAQPRGNPPVAFVWDTPLLFETGLSAECDALVFVDAPPDVRLERVRGRGWDATELARRENLQWGLDRKREISEYQVTNTAGADDVRRQVRHVLSRILARSHQGTGLQ
jgi:dephospho-CoA kinase